MLNVACIYWKFATCKASCYMHCINYLICTEGEWKKKPEKQLLFIAESLRGTDLILIVWLLKRSPSSFEERSVTQSQAVSSSAIALAFPCVSRLLTGLLWIWTDNAGRQPIKYTRFQPKGKTVCGRLHFCKELKCVTLIWSLLPDSATGDQLEHHGMKEAWGTEAQCSRLQDVFPTASLT